MNINFTEKEYRLLLDMVFLADWILTAHDVEQPSEDDPYQMLFQKLYSHAGEMGYGHLVETVTELNRYAPSRQYEEESEVFDWIDDYEDVSFWEGLLERLAERDVYAELPRDSRLEDEEFRRRAAPHEQKYAQEFDRHGIERLVIDET